MHLPQESDFRQAMYQVDVRIHQICSLQASSLRVQERFKTVEVAMVLIDLSNGSPRTAESYSDGGHTTISTTDSDEGIMPAPAADAQEDHSAQVRHGTR